MAKFMFFVILSFSAIIALSFATPVDTNLEKKPVENIEINGENVQVDSVSLTPKKNVKRGLYYGGLYGGGLGSLGGLGYGLGGYYPSYSYSYFPYYRSYYGGYGYGSYYGRGYGFYPYSSGYFW